MRSCLIDGLGRGLLPALLGALCVLGRQAPAATPNLAELLRPAGIRDVRLSPSGLRVAALIKEAGSDSDLLVLEEHQGKLSSLLATHLAAPDAVASYQWLSDDYLAIYYASADQEFTQFAIGDIPHHSIDVQEPGEVQMAATNQQLYRDLPAEFGVSGSEQLADPAQWAPHLPSNLMLAYDTLPRVQQEFAAESRKFRGAVQSSGKHLDFYTAESVSSDDIQSRDRLLQAVIDYLQRAMTTAASSSVARSP